MRRLAAPLAAFLVACAGATPEPAYVAVAPSAPSTPAAAPSAPPARPATAGWVHEPFEFAKLDKGVLGYAQLDDGGVVAALSYTLPDKPFRVLRASRGDMTPAEVAPPWSCDASPAEVEASGNSVWVHCIDPGPSKSARVHFWESDDGGRTWSRAGALDGLIAMGRYAFRGPTLFISGPFEGKPAALHVVTRSGARWSAAAAKPSPADEFWGGTFLQAIVVSEDAKTIALVRQADLAGKGRRLAVALSHDGGKTIGALADAPWDPNWDFESASLVGDTLSLLVVTNTRSGLVGVLTASIDGPLATFRPMTTLDLGKASACLHGPFVAARTNGGWKLSRDAGVTFESIAPPGSSEEPRCSNDGVRAGSEFFRWK